MTTIVETIIIPIAMKRIAVINGTMSQLDL
jgi:hypothetical protein